MANGTRPPRKKRVNLDMECDAFGCRPKKKIPKGAAIPVFGGKDDASAKPVTRYDWEVEETQEQKAGTVPETDVMLDVSQVGPGGEETQLFKGTYQEAQNKDALAAAAKASKTFTPTKLPVFQEESSQSLLKGGADPRTISPTAKPGEGTTISKQPITKVKEQQLRQLLGDDYQIAQDKKLRSRTQYETTPDGKREAIKRIEYSPEAVTEMNLRTGRMKITDLTTGEVKYQDSKDVKVEKNPKEGVRKVKSMESVVNASKKSKPSGNRNRYSQPLR